MKNTALSAAQGIDTRDLLNHIAWTDVIKPQITTAKTFLTERLVSATLHGQQPGAETREQIAGKLYGIDYVEKMLEKILREGARAEGELASQNLFLQ